MSINILVHDTILDDELILFVTTFLEIFEMVKLTTLKLQSANLIIGDFYKLWMELKLRLHTFEHDMARNLLIAMETRENNLLENYIVSAALYIESR